MTYCSGLSVGVLDIDSTLLQAVPTANIFHLLNNPELMATGRISVLEMMPETSVIWRPHVFEALSKFGKSFDCLGIWTAGIRQYGLAVAHEISKRSTEMQFVFCREKCHMDRNGNYTKPNSFLLQVTHGLSEIINPNNILLIDDKPYSPNPVENGILIPPYEINYFSVENVMAEDTYLIDLANFLIQELPKTKDYRKLDRTRIFKKKT